MSLNPLKVEDMPKDIHILSFEYLQIMGPLITVMIQEKFNYIFPIRFKLEVLFMSPILERITSMTHSSEYVSLTLGNHLYPYVYKYCIFSYRVVN